MNSSKYKVDCFDVCIYFDFCYTFYRRCSMDPNPLCYAVPHG